MNLPAEVHDVNISGVAVSGQSRHQPYHHGDLRNALVQAGVQLARAGGPQAIVLREVARRVGVSANAAYRHFHDLTELVDAVRCEGQDELAAAMQDEIARLAPDADAIARLCAVGRGYVRFATTQPGLFATAFNEDKADPERPGPDETADSAWGQLQLGLDALVAEGLLAPEDRDAATIHAWASVHGLSMLLLGPLAAVPPAGRDHLIDSTLDLVLRGLLIRPGHAR